ncbi:MAG: alkaline phosphatase family protein, partial [Thermoplasmata archaeon]|nr:alkaline phosphatase family protein [Thermoplasmata archaeon]
LIDAFRHDFLSVANTPRLAELADGGLRRPLQPILGYSDAIRATLFTGRPPDETGYWMEYAYRPSESPWKGFGRLAPLDRFPSDLALRGLKLAASSTVMKPLAARRGRPHLSLRAVPFRAIDRFDLTLHEPMTAPKALGYPSIFDACTASGRPWAYLDSSRVKRGSDLLDMVDRLPEDVGLVFVYLHQIDMAAHLFGIESPTFWKRVRSTDALFGDVRDRLVRRFTGASSLVLSDHGMSVLTHQTGIPELTSHPGFPDRFFVALDATMVRLWYLDDDEKLRREVRERVAERFSGRFLTSEDLARYHLDFTDRLYGDEIFLLTPGTAIFPNFHSFIKPKAMHAYAPEDRDQWGIFIGPGSVSDHVSDPVDLTEVTALILDAIDPYGA